MTNHDEQDAFERDINEKIKWLYRINKKLPEVISEMAEQLSEKRTRTIWKSLKNDQTCVKFIDDKLITDEIRYKHQSGMTVDEIYNNGFETATGILFKPRDYGFTKHILTHKNYMNLGKHKTKSELVYDIIAGSSTDMTYTPQVLYSAKKEIYGVDEIDGKEKLKTKKYDNNQINQRLRDGGYVNRDIESHQNHHEMSDIIDELIDELIEYTKFSNEVMDLSYTIQQIDGKPKDQIDRILNTFKNNRREKCENWRLLMASMRSLTNESNIIHMMKY